MAVVTLHGQQWHRYGRGAHVEYYLKPDREVLEPLDLHASPLRVKPHSERQRAPLPGKPKRTRVIWTGRWQATVSPPGGITGTQTWSTRDDAMLWGLKVLEDAKPSRPRIPRFGRKGTKRS